MIRILFVFGDLFKRGGTESVMQSIFDHIDRTGFHIDFLLMSDEPDDTALTKHIEGSGSRVYHIVRRGKDYSAHRKALKDFFTDHKYDIVHTHMDAIGDEALAAAKKAGVKVRVAHSHSTDQLPSPKLLREHIHKCIIRMERHRLRKLATHYVACSTDAGEWLFGKERCVGDRFLLFRNAIDPGPLIYSKDRYNEVRSRLGITDEVVIGHVGSFLYPKNHEFLIRIFDELTGRIKAKLLLIGAGELEQDVRKLVSELELDDKVLFMGVRADVSDLLQGMDAFVFPSRYEGLPLAVIEAQTSGLNCIVSDRISHEVDITELVTFLSINEGTGAWVDAIIKLIQDRAPRTSPLDAVRNAGYDMQTNIRELEEFYTNAVKGV